LFDHGLMPSWRKVNDGQPPVAQQCARKYGNTSIVWAAVRE
jgi:hypothetical protein